RADEPHGVADHTRRRAQAEAGRAAPRGALPDSNLRRALGSEVRDRGRYAMRRIALAVVISVLGARAASAQAAPPGAAAKRAAQNAANATTAHIVAEQRTSDPAVEPQSKKTPVATG